MTTWKLLVTSWNFEPSVVFGCALLLAVYFFAVRFKLNRKSCLYTLGVLVIFLALVSPLDALGDDYLFSAHMVQHMMIGLVAPPLLVAGIPAPMARGLLRLPFADRLEQILGFPPLALLSGVVTLWIWHLPLLYDLTLENDAVHVFEHLTLLVTGTMLWWPVFKPISKGRLTPLGAIAYLGVAGFASSILGIIFTISDTPFYAAYAHPHDELGALKLIRQDWGLTQLDDQKLGGAIMWEPMGVIFLWSVMAIMIKWFKESETNSLQGD
jgi:cytochrome c oxidase assembly factor CtaG